MQIVNQEYYDEVVKYAVLNGLKEQLDTQFTRLKELAKNSKGALVLGKDFAPYSFYFGIVRGGKTVLNGGLIFHGKHDNGGDGSYPTLSVTMSPVNGWSIHT